MNITDIVNRDVVNLTNCESEPIHIPGTIQPHGFLLGLKTENHIIDFCSANSKNFIGLPPEVRLANAHSFVIYHQGKLYKNGTLPTDAELISLFKSLSEKYPKTGLYSEQLVDIYPEFKNLSKYAAGVIYHSIAAGSPDGVLWPRAERRETINWAGNPHKAVVVNEDGCIRLSPRKSFALWMEEVKNKSERWRKAEINSASSFTYALQKHINFHYVRNQENKNRILNDELKAANKELANLNWISTHDLKEPLRKIQIFASKVLDREKPDLSALVN
jgi:chemotaxis family two-component system sensor kinase Cph1